MAVPANDRPRNFGTLMGPIEEALREKFSPALFGREYIDAYLRKSMGHTVKNGGLSIPYPRLSEESV